MKRTRRSVAFLALALVAFVACTNGNGEDGRNGNGGNATGPTPTGETAPTPVGVTGASEETATYEYVNAGLRVVMRIDGTAGTLEVDNGTDHDVGRPDFYLLHATTGAEVTGRVDGAAPVAAGDTGAFDVSFSGIRIRDIGLVLLLLGRDNYGAFVRTA